MSDTHFMQQALIEANQADNPSPNPRVGCVIVKDGEIISRGFHAAAGQDHAEVAALKKIRGFFNDCTMYVTLEPCNHHGKTPPCAQTIIDIGIISHVIIAMTDPNPTAQGGIQRLQAAGIKVTTGILEKEARELNQIWLKSLTHPHPYLTLKLGLTADGQTIHPEGKQWITCEKSLNMVQSMRKRHDSILVGVGTIVADDPRLTVRGHNTQPIRLIIDPHGRTPKNARIFSEPGRTIILSHVPYSHDTAENLIFADFTLDTILKGLKDAGITSIFLEGGRITAENFLVEKLIDHVDFFYATKDLKSTPLWDNEFPFTDKATHQAVGVDTLVSENLREY